MSVSALQGCALTVAVVTSGCGGGSMPGVDGGTTSDGAGGLSDPDWTTLTVGPAGSCPDLAPCGGDVVGTWDLAGGCFEVDVESAISSCPGAMVTRREGRGRGRVVFGADGRAHRVASSEVEVDVFIPALCASVVSCATIESAMTAYATEASCTPTAAGACDCTARLLTTIDDRDGYTVEGDEIVSATLGRRWEYCIEGDSLCYRDVSATEPREPGTVELARR